MDYNLFGNNMQGGIPNVNVNGGHPSHPGMNIGAVSEAEAGMSNSLRQHLPSMSGPMSMSTSLSNGINTSGLSSSVATSLVQNSGVNAQSTMGAAPTVSLPLASSTLPGMRCGGLEYANMKKEKAREEYKEKRRLELLANGEYDRTKRRKKNDTSMSENQKYHRRLKMNQDSAAAARHAQEVYVSTLEKLVETTEAEKSILSLEAVNLRAERDELARRVHSLQQELESAHSKNRQTDDSVVAESGGCAPETNNDVNASTHIMIRKVLEMMEAPDGIGAPAEFAKSIVGIQPAPAV